MVKYFTMECAAFGCLRVIVTDNEILFCANDIAQMLGYKRPNNAVHDHCFDLRRYDIPTTSGVQTVNFITADEAVCFAYDCNLPNAELFRVALYTAIVTITKEFFTNELDDESDEDEDKDRARKEYEAVVAEAEADLEEIEQAAGQLAVMKLCFALIEWVYQYIEENCKMISDECADELNNEQEDEDDASGVTEKERFMDALLTAVYSMAR